MPPARALWAAAKTSSTSYRIELPPEVLRQALASGAVPAGFEAHLLHLLDEAPFQLLAGAVAATAELEQLAPETVWCNVRLLAADLGAYRSRSSSG